MGSKNFFIDGPVQPSFIADQIAKHNSKHGIGAHSIFLGQVRADTIENKQVTAIEYSAYDEMANKKIAEIRENSFSQWTLSCLHIYHSKGLVKTGEISLFVFVSSAHRQDCIKAMQSIVEDIKHHVPVWKKEILEDKTAHWVQE